MARRIGTKHTHGLRRGLHAVLIVLLSTTFVACEKAKRADAPAIKQRDSLPVLQTEGITSFISDSGITKYCIKTKEWNVYDRTQVPRWVFEKGLLLEQFDRKYKVIATMKSDTAYYYTQHRVWELKGNVDINNLITKQRITGTQLFWDQDRERLYSNRPFLFERPDRVINGSSFESNQDFTIFHIFNTNDGKIVFDENRLNEQPTAPPPTHNPFAEEVL